MKTHRNVATLIKIVLIGGLLVVLAYLFHPDSELFSVTINGQPVAEPLARVAAVPTILVVLLLTGVLILCAFIGAGVIVLVGMLFFAVLGIGFVAPFLWPLLIIVLVTVVLTSFANRHG